MASVRKRIGPLVKTLLATLIVAAVGWHFYRLLGQPQLWQGELTLRGQWLFPAALLYLAAHAVWAVFGRQAMERVGDPVGPRVWLRAYFLSQFGKYVPGKAWVILLRIAILRGISQRRATVGLASTYETLIAMAAGAAVGVVLLPWVGVGQRLFVGQEIFFVGMALLPLGLPLLNRWLVRIARKYQEPNAPPFPTLPLSLILRGLVQAVFGWLLLGVSLWLTLYGMTSMVPEWKLSLLLQCTGIVSLAYVAGFAALVTPGGAGVRELLLQQLLSTMLRDRYASAQAEALSAAIALALRLLWTLAELLAAALLYRWGRTSR